MIFGSRVLTFALLPLSAFAAEPPCAGTQPSRTLVVAPAGGQHTTIQAALDAAGPGDLVLVKAGQYRGGITLPKSGAPGKCLVLRGEPGAVISGGSRGISVRDKSYFVIQGLTVQNIQGGETPIGIDVRGGSHHFEIRNNLVQKVLSSENAHGMAFYGTSQTPLSDFLVDGNEVKDCRLGQSESLVLNGNVTRFVVSRNKVHDNDNIGIDLIGFEGQGPSGQDYVRGGSVVENQVWNISSARNPTYGGEHSAGGIYVDGGSGISIERNKITNADIGVEVASEHAGRTTQGVTVRGNEIANSYQGNVMIGGYDSGRGKAAAIVVDANRMSNGRDGQIIVQWNSTGLTFTNNVMQGRPGSKFIISNGGRNFNVQLKGNQYLGGTGGRANGVYDDAGGILLQVLGQ